VSCSGALFKADAGEVAHPRAVARPPADASRVAFDRAAMARYVLSRRTPEGGYCYYRTPAWGVEEPDAPDTLAALMALRLLGVPPPEPAATARFLRSLQERDGGFPTLTIGWAALRGLDVLGFSPDRSPLAWLDRWHAVLLGPPRAGGARGAGGPPGSGEPGPGEARTWAVLLRDVLHLMELRRLDGSFPDDPGRAATRELLAEAADPSGGWARPEADLETTGRATRLAMAAGLARDELEGAADLLGRCEDPVLGLRLTPGTGATASGALWGGLVVAAALDARLRYPDAVAASLVELQRPDGGLGRRHRAISTLDDTWRGLEAAALFDQLEEEAR
jgi:hypothetical protein